MQQLNLTREAAVRWADIDEEARERILASIWCSFCVRSGRVTGCSGHVDGVDVILQAFCERCGGPVVRVLEGD